MSDILGVSDELYSDSKGHNHRKQKEAGEYQELSPLQQRKSDALELAELIYAIYNNNCPTEQLNTNRGAKNDI
jgi:hypothetical protein